jgi:acetylornithine deacetylase/succinyl-diaminopimelate desuccinylase-like protein
MSYEAYIASHRDDFESRFFDALRFPSVSVLDAHRSDVRRTADWFRNQFARLGLNAALSETEGHAIVFAE